MIILCTYIDQNPPSLKIRPMWLPRWTSREIWLVNPQAFWVQSSSAAFRTSCSIATKDIRSNHLALSRSSSSPSYSGQSRSAGLSLSPVRTCSTIRSHHKARCRIAFHRPFPCGAAAQHFCAQPVKGCNDTLIRGNPRLVVPKRSMRSLSNRVAVKQLMGTQ
jgi:hypothetical protein